MDVVVVRHAPSVVVVVVVVAGLHIPFASVVVVVVVKHRLYSPWHSLPTCQTLNMRNRYMDIAYIAAAVEAAVGIGIAAAVGIGIDTVGVIFSIQDPDG